MSKIKMIKEKMVQECMDSFDFKKVQSAMDKMDLEWLLPGGKVGVPSVRHLKKIARGLLEDLSIDGGDGALLAATGGFCARYDRDVSMMELLFYVAETSSFQADHDPKKRAYR